MERKLQKRSWADFLTERPLTIRCRTYLNSKEEIVKSLENQGVEVTPAPYLPYAYGISGFNHILALDAFIKGQIVVQDVSSMLVAEVANPKKGDYVIDVCAAPGGKSLHMGDKMEGYGTVDARDVSQYKVNLIEENIQRTNSINVQAKVQDATVFDQESELLADIVIADVPCSGYGVIGKKPEIKYPGNSSETGGNRNPAENHSGPCSQLCEAKRRTDLQYLHHCKRRKRREYDVVFAELSV